MRARDAIAVCGLLLLQVGCGEGDEAAEVQIGSTTVALDASEETLRVREAAFGDFVADALRAAVPGAVAAVVNAGAIRMDESRMPGGVLPAGPITDADVAAWFPPDLSGSDDVVGLTLTGADLRSVLERGVSSLNSAAGATEEEREGWFLQVSGLRVEADTARQAQVYKAPPVDAVDTPGDRILEVDVGAMVVDPEATYRIATLDFLAEGRDGHVAARNGTDRQPAGVTFLDLMTRTLREQSPIAPAVDGRLTIR